MTKRTAEDTPQSYALPKVQTNNNPVADVVDSIQRAASKVLNPHEYRAEERRQFEEGRRIISAAGEWNQNQNRTFRATPVVPRRPNSESTDSIEIFFRSFFSNLATSYFEATIIEQIKTAIAAGLSGVLHGQADSVVQFFLKDMPEVDVSDKKTADLANAMIGYLMHLCPTDANKRAVLEEAMVNCGCMATHAERFLERCTIVEIRDTLGPDKVNLFARQLGLILVPRLLRSAPLLSNFSGAVYRTIKPIIEGSIGNMTGVSPVVKVVADLGSLLIAKRVTKLFRSLDLKVLFDQAVAQANLHIKAHSVAHTALAKQFREDSSEFINSPQALSLYKSQFAATPGCHPLSRRLMTAHSKDNLYPEMIRYFEGFAGALVDYVLDDKTIEAFVLDLDNHKEALLKGVDQPFVNSLIENLLKPENAALFANTLKGIKPLVKQAIAQGIYSIGLQKIFSNTSIYKVLYDRIAPTVADVIQKVIIKRIIYTEIDKSDFAKQVILLFENYLVKPESALNETPLIKILSDKYQAKVYSAQKNNPNILNQLPNLVQLSLKEFMDVLKAKGWVPGQRTTISQEIKLYFEADFSDNTNEYGEFIMNMIFKLPRQNTVVSAANRMELNQLKILTNLFTVLFLNGIYDLRGVDKEGIRIPGLDPNQVLFDMIKDSLLPYQEPKVVRDLFQGVTEPMSSRMIEERTAKEAEAFANILYDLIRFNAGAPVAMAVDAALTGGLRGQLIFVLKNLFGRNMVNFNLQFYLLDILQKQFETAKNRDVVQ